MIWLGWLLRLRWVAIVAQLVTLALTFGLIDRPGTTLPVLLGVIAVLGVANLASIPRLHRRTPIRRGGLLAHLVLDVVALTVFFAFAGGNENPFTVLYLIHVAMAGIMLPPRSAATLTAIVLACYCAIHVWHHDLHLEGHAIAADTIRSGGQLLSFVVTVGSVAVFVLGLAGSLRDHKQQLLDTRVRTARIDRLRAVGTLAAGAAHELNTPLSTIGLRIRRIGRRHPDDATLDDLTIVRNQLERCKGVVDQLLLGAGDPSASGMERCALAPLTREAVALWKKGASVGLDLVDESDGLYVEVPRIAFTQALINLLENARQAQEENGATDPLLVTVRREGPNGVLEVVDRGCGLPAEAEHVGDPFFTTKETGTGLGVFVARALADGAGGGLSYSARPEGPGTIARWWFPEHSR